MKFGAALLMIGGSTAFAPVRFGASRLATTARSFGVDPHFFHDLPQHVDALKDAFSTINLADAVDVADVVPTPDVIPTPDIAAVTAASDTATDTAAAAASSSGNGWFGFLTGPIEGLLQVIHSVLVAVGLSANSWGVSIFFMTVIIKLLTFPLTKTQLESTNKMQALQPQIKELQAKYQSNPEVMNQKIAELYQTNEVNPLAGCIPSLVQIPVFIGLYRAVLTLAKDDKLNEPFLFLPNLEGPTYGADPTHANDWILKGWENGTPPLGWDDTVAFLILPIFLVISQFISTQLMQPQPGPDGQKPEQPIILKFLPLMIGYFSLSVPAALTIYWVTNNIITTATTLFIRNQMIAAPVGGGSATASPPPPKSVFAPPPMREKPSGFGDVFADSPDIKPLTPIDAVVVEDDDDDDYEDDGDEEVEEDDTTLSQAASSGGTGMQSSPVKKRGGSKKKKKKKN